MPTNASPYLADNPPAKPTDANPYIVSDTSEPQDFWSQIVRGLTGSGKTPNLSSDEVGRMYESGAALGPLGRVASDTLNAIVDPVGQTEKGNPVASFWKGWVMDPIAMGGPSEAIASAAVRGLSRPGKAVAKEIIPDTKLLKAPLPDSTWMRNVLRQILDASSISKGVQTALNLGEEQLGLGVKGERGIGETIPAGAKPAEPAAEQLGIGLGRPQGAEQTRLGIREDVTRPVPAPKQTDLELGTGYMQQALMDIPIETRRAIRATAETLPARSPIPSPFYALEDALNFESRVVLADGDINTVEKGLAQEEASKRVYQQIGGGAQDPNALARAKALVSGLMLNGKQNLDDLSLNANQILFSAGSSVLRAAGAAGRKLADSFDAFWDRYTGLAGGDQFALSNLIKGLGRAVEEQRASLDKIRTVREWALNPLSERFSPPRLNEAETAVHQWITSYLQDVMPQRVTALEQKLGLQPGTIVPQWENSSTYWPWKMDREIYGQNAKGYEEAFKNLVDHIQKMNPGISFTQAQGAAMRILNRAVKPFGNFAKERTVAWLPYEFRQKALEELNHYISGGNKWLAQIEHFGLKGEKAQELITNMQQKGEDWKFGFRWFREVMGLRNTADQEIERDLIANVNSFQMATKGMFVSFRHAPQALLYGFLKAGIGNTLRGFLKSFSNWEEATQFAGKAGVLFSNLQKELQQLATTGAKQMGGHMGGQELAQATGLPWIMKANTILSAGVGKEWLDSAVTRLDKAGLSRVFSPEEVERLLVSKVGDIPIDLQQKAARYFFENIMLPIKPGTLPLGWSDPWVRLATMFRAFHFKSTKLLWDAVVTHGIKEGNYRPLLTVATIFPMFGELSKDAQMYLTHVRAAYTDIQEGRPEDTLRDVTGGQSFFLTVPELMQGKPEAIKPFVQAYFRNLAYAGGLGMFDQLFQIMNTGRASNLVGNLFGPTASDIVNVGGALVNEKDLAMKALEGEETQAGDYLKKAKPLIGEVPFLGPILRDVTGGGAVKPSTGENIIDVILKRMGVQ